MQGSLTSCASLALCFACSFPVLRLCRLPCKQGGVLRSDTILSNVHCAPAVCRHRISGSLSLPSRGPFHLSFTVLCSIGHQVVFSLSGWSPFLPTRFHVPRGTPDTARPSSPFAYGAFTLFGRLFQNRSARFQGDLLRSIPRGACTTVWAPPLSLAATHGITVVFSSSAYLDVSVQRVSPCMVMYSPCSD